MLAVLLLAFALAPRVFAQEVDMHNPIGIVGIFNGNVTTGCSYDPLSHSARREVTDLVVPGSIGKYPLKMTRYYNSRHQLSGAMGPGWSFEYSWGLSTNGSKLTYPNGNVLDKWCQQPVGISDKWQTGPLCYGDGCDGDFRLSDGGTVHFGNGRTTAIDDPYGQTTTITYAPDLSWMKVTEPGGRYLLFTYNGPQGKLSKVEAYDGVQGHPRIDWVNYSYTLTPPGGNGTSLYCLTGVAYSDGTSAAYTYTEDNVQTQWKVLPLLATASDNRYHGPMRQIAYNYQSSNAPHGAITAEKFSAGGALVSRITPGATSCTSFNCTMETDFTETRGDGLSRTFHYTDLRYYSDPEDQCPQVQDPQPPSQFLLSYTDFKNNTTYLGYDSNWYVNSVKDANNHTTYYTRGPNIGEITQIKHPDLTHVDYIYYNEGTGYIGGHYLKQITDERWNVTFYGRDGNNRLTYIWYEDNQNNVIAGDGYAYNSFGQVITHLLKNGAFESFVYDGRGLLTDKYNPKFDAIPGGSDPHTHYTYYTSGPWTDRVQTMTLPANGQGLQARETYEYDRALDANGVTNLAGAAVPGRGLITKITHRDTPSDTYQRFKYDAYGNKRWEDNELGKVTSYTYDEYNRLLTVKDPIGQTTGHQTTYTYNPTNGTGNRLSHTTNNPDTLTTAAGILTTNVYDENFRKQSTTLGSSTTAFDYDNVGNLTWVTDPLTHKTYNTYDNRNRKTSTTEAWGTNVQATTVWHYDGASNINQIDRPDGQHEWKGYDALNRMTWHNVKRQIPNSNESEDLTTGFGYWPSGKLLWVQDPNHYGGSLLTYFDYNESDQMITMYYPDPSLSIVQSWTYDDAHNLASRTTVNNETQSFTYDIRNRKTGMNWSNGADSASFTYYADNRLATASNPNSLITRTYDAAGRLASDQQSVTGLGAKNVTYPLYDDDGRLKQISVAGAYDYTFSYDTMGRFLTITPTGGSVGFKYSYDGASNVTDRYTYINSITVDQQTPRDSLNRISSRWIYKNATPLAVEGYTYDHMNRLGKVSRGSVYDWLGYYWDGELAASVYGVPQAGPVQPQAGQDLDLDTDGSTDPWAGYQPPEVAEPEHTPPPPRPPPTPHPRPTPPPTPTPSPTPTPPPPPLGAAVYVYDPTGNRTWMADDVNGGKDYVPNDLNQYTSITGSTMSNGNEHEVSTHKGPNDARLVTYSYLNDEHLVSVNDGAGGGANHYNLAYDALGRCVKRVLNGTTTYYVYDGDKPILEYGPNNALAKNLYGKGIDENLMRTDSTVNSGQSFYYGQDYEGSVTHLINASGNIIESYRYDAFGAVAMYNGGGTQISSTAYNNRFLFTGREYAATYQKTYVPAFKFYEYRARAYNPTLGRFMSEDHKLADTGDYNLFRYCHNDPIDFTDPMGLEETREPWYNHQEHAKALDREYGLIMAAAQMNSSGGAISVASLASTMTTQLHAGVMNYSEAAGLQTGVGHRGVSNSISEKPQTLVLSGGPVWDPYVHKWVLVPPRASLDKNITETKRMSVPSWIKAVNQHGKWDYKDQGPYRDFGNINYGATGRALGYDALTLRGGGFAYKLFHGTITTKDLARDQYMIQTGIDYYNSQQTY